MAVKEVPHKHFIWVDGEAVIYKGFRISKKGDVYSWHDARYSDYMEPVDPIITSKIIELGFCNAITEVTKHTDKIRVVELAREMEKIDAEVTYWTSEAYKAHNKSIKNQKKTKESAKLEAIKKKYEKEKSRFAKKRGVLKSEREALQADINFYESRVKLYNN